MTDAIPTAQPRSHSFRLGVAHAPPTISPIDTMSSSRSDISGLTPSPAQVTRGLGPRRKIECKALLSQPAGHHSATLEDQLGLAAEQPGADLQHPRRGCQA